MSTLAVWWIPVGAGGWLVRRASGLWERRAAVREGRAARTLLHAAIEITHRRGRSVIEMAPGGAGREQHAASSERARSGYRC